MIPAAPRVLCRGARRQGTARRPPAPAGPGRPTARRRPERPPRLAARRTRLKKSNAAKSAEGEATRFARPPLRRAREAAECARGARRGAGHLRTRSRCALARRRRRRQRRGPRDDDDDAPAWRDRDCAAHKWPPDASRRTSPTSRCATGLPVAPAERRRALAFAKRQRFRLPRGAALRHRARRAHRPTTPSTAA